jgi:hypothetical protein
LRTEKRCVFSQHPLVFDKRSAHLRNHLALIYRCIPGCVGCNAQFFHGLPGLLRYPTQLLSRIPFFFCALTTALGMPPISLRRCSSDFRSNALQLSLSAPAFPQFVFECVRPARLSPRRSSLVLTYSCHRGCLSFTFFLGQSSLRAAVSFDKMRFDIGRLRVP